MVGAAELPGSRLVVLHRHIRALTRRLSPPRGKADLGDREVFHVEHR